jgi:hypothetical protein
MRLISDIRKLGGILAGLAFFAMSFQTIAFAETRLFIPDFRIGASLDTQLLLSNSTDRDANVDVWAFLNEGKLLGQTQLHVSAHAIQSLTLAEVFGSRPDEVKGWLAAVSDSDGIEMSYSRLGQSPEPHDAEGWPKREVALDIPRTGEYAVRIMNTGAVANNVTVRRKNQTGGFIGLQELRLGPFQQLELTRETLQDTAHIDILANSDVLAAVTETGVRLHPRLSNVTDDGTLSLVIDRNAPVGAYQVLLRFDPAAIQFSQDDILGGSAAGFTSKPLAVNIDNIAGELRIASLQVGSEPQGAVDVAHIRLRSIQPSKLEFGLKVEEITDLQGRSALKSIVSVRLVRLN